MKILWRFAPLSLILSAAYLGTPFFIHAQSTTLSISPLTFELTANPGDSISNVIRVFNNGDAPMSITMVAEDFTAAGERGEVALSAEGRETFSLSKWITVIPESFIVNPHSFQAVQFTVSVPLNGEPGGHYGSVLASSGAVEPGSGGAAIAQKIGSLLLLQVAGAVQEEMSIRSFTAPAFSEYGPITMTGRFENTGTVHLKPRGFVLVKDVLGRETARLELPQLNVLPNSIRQVDTELPDKRLFGKYSATLTAIYGSTNEPLAYTTTFWVVPWKVLGATLIGLLILAFLLYLARRRLSLALSVLVTGKKR